MDQISVSMKSRFNVIRPSCEMQTGIAWKIKIYCHE